MEAAAEWNITIEDLINTSLDIGNEAGIHDLI